MAFTQVFLDVETKKTFDAVGGYNPHLLEVSFAGVIVRTGFLESGEGTQTRLELFEHQLNQLWKVIEQADLIVGFNIKGFDFPALSPYYHGNWQKLPILDMLEAVKNTAGHRVSLDALAHQTLGTQKSGSGLDAIKYFESKQYDKLAAYCMKDVEITRDLCDYGRQYGELKFLNRWNNPVAVKVDFSIDSRLPLSTQMSLL